MQQQDLHEKTQLIAKLQAELASVTEENKVLREDNKKRVEESSNAQKMKTEACAAVIKLDEARVAMNRLLGPQGPLTQSERHKFLTNKESDYRAHNPSPAPKTLNDSQNDGGIPHHQKRDTFGGEAQEVGDGEDDFWYQTPKDGQ